MAFTLEGWPTDEELGSPTPAGPPKTLIHCDEVAKGWVYVRAENPPADPTPLPYMLNDAFGRWLKQNPKATIRAVLPIVAGGNTVAIHVFFD